MRHITRPLIDSSNKKYEKNVMKVVVNFSRPPSQYFEFLTHKKINLLHSVQNPLISSNRPKILPKNFEN